MLKNLNKDAETAKDYYKAILTELHEEMLKVSKNLAKLGSKKYCSSSFPVIHNKNLH